MIKRVIICITIVCAAALGAFLWFTNVKDQEQAMQYEQLYEKRRPLLVKKESLEQQLVYLENEYEASKLQKGTTQVVFTGLEADVYNKCYPTMKEFGYVGTLAVSNSQLPGMEGRMTVEQFQELISAGWNVCVKWNAAAPANKWWPELEKRMGELGVPMSATAYFVAGTYSPKLDAELQKRGISIVIHHGEEGMALIQTAEEEGLWHLGAVGLMGEKPKLKLREAIAQKGNMTYLVGFELEDEMYDERSFNSMLSCFEQYVKTSELHVMDFATTRQHYRERLVDYGQAREDEYNQAKAAVEAELKAVEDELNKLEIQ